MFVPEAMPGENLQQKPSR